MGSALALFSISDSKIPPVNDFFREVISSVSFVVLVSTFFWIDDLKFPGWKALAPVLSTAFLIWTGPQTIIARRVLSNHAVVWVGLISYPLYLYHWPLLIFFESSMFAEYKIAAISVSVFLSILFAAITYKYVEVPVRRSRTTRNLVFLILMGTAIAAIAVLIRAGYLQGRIQSHEVELVEEAMSDWAIPEDNYRKLAGFELLDLQRGDSNILVIGDSHASQYYSWFDKNLHALSQQGLGVQFATYGGCPLLPKVNRLEAGYGCPQFYDFALRYAQSSSVQFIIFSVWWEHYFGLRNDSTDPLSTVDADLSDLNTIAEEFGKDLDKLVQSGKKVVVLLSNPTSSSFHPGNMISRIDGGMKKRGISRTDFLNYNLPVSSIINMHLDRPGVRLIDTTLYYCDQDYCPAVNEDGVPIYKDSHHLRSSYVEQHADFLFEFLGIAKPDRTVQ